MLNYTEMLLTKLCNKLFAFASYIEQYTVWKYLYLNSSLKKALWTY